MIIANFTEEEIPWRHGGEAGILKPDEIKEFSDGAANHIFNAMGPRGLLKLKFEEANNPDLLSELKKKAKTINRQFWERNITNFNRHNETLQNENKAYDHPTKELEQMAEKMGIELKGPWKIKKTEPDNAEINSLKNEVHELKKMITDMSSGIPEREDAVREATLKSLYAALDTKNFEKFVKMSLGTIIGWPESIQNDIKERWEKDIPDKPYPLS